MFIYLKSLKLKNSEESIKKFSLAIRIWHWLNAIAITGLLLTVLINSTLINRKTAVSLYHQYEKKIFTDDAQIKAVAHAISEQVWAVHIYFGYGLVALFLFRLLLEFYQAKHQKFGSNLSESYQRLKTSKSKFSFTLDKFWVKLIYLLFYVLTLIMVVTGLLIVFKKELHIPKNISHDIKEIHGFCMYLILSFIALHLFGVIKAEATDQKGIVSEMINGGDI